jgi:glycosyltransferase involved in cell wall biosynthesis
MQIAYITETYPPEINGVALTVERTVRDLMARGHGVQRVRPRQPGEAPRDDTLEWRTAGLPLPMYRDLRFGLARVGALRRRFSAGAAELVHVATPGPLAWAAVLAARSLGLPVTSDFRTNFHQYSGYYGLGLLGPLLLGGLRRFHNSTHRTFVPTLAAQRALQAEGFENLVVVGRGVDTRRFRPAQRSPKLRAAWGAGEADSRVLLHVGRIAKEKNVALALAAFERLRARWPQWRMVVVGDGPQRAALEAAHPAVRFVGMQQGEALARSYASADAFVFPSLTDTFGNVVLEALASALPVVAFDAAAAQEHVVHGRSGLLVAPGDEAGFAAAVERLVARVSQPGLGEAMGAAALQTARCLTWPAMLALFESQLEDAIHAGRGLAPSAAVVA